VAGSCRVLNAALAGIYDNNFEFSMRLAKQYCRHASALQVLAGREADKANTAEVDSLWVVAGGASVIRRL